MKVLLYGINYAPEKTGAGKYSAGMCQWLAAKGHEVRVVTAQPYYPEWKVHAGYSKYRFATYDLGGVKVYRCPLYIPAKTSTFKRLLHLFSFAMTSFVSLVRNFSFKPDVIITVVPTFFVVCNAILYSKLTGARLVLHIQDYELDAMLGLGMAKGGLLTRFLKGIEKFLLRRFDKVSSVSQSMLDKALAKGVDAEKLILVPNWNDLLGVVNQQEVSLYKADIGLESSAKIVLYSGNLGEKQGLELVIEAAEIFCRTHPHICFAIVGEGSSKARLQALVKEKALSTVHFYPLQSSENLSKLLSMADCHLVVQRRGIADAVMPSKLANILAIAGNAVITADPDTEMGRLCKEHQGIAVCVKPESLEALNNGVKLALDMPKHNRAAFGYAQQYLNRDRILLNYEECIIQLVERNAGLV